MPRGFFGPEIQREYYSRFEERKKVGPPWHRQGQFQGVQQGCLAVFNVCTGATTWEGHSELRTNCELEMDPEYRHVC